jgi:hypothetical protein
LLKVLEACQLVPLFMLYSKAPLPVALTTMVPVVTAQVGCVTVGALTVGGVQAPAVTVTLLVLLLNNTQAPALNMAEMD